MKTISIFCAFFLFLPIFFNSNAHALEEKKGADSIHFTWMSNTNWLVEVGDTRILLDGWITRIPRGKRPDMTHPETFSFPPVKPDAKAVSRVLEALGIDKKLNYIFSGHSHFDHSFDTAVWARLTGAKIFGPKSSCLQAIAQGIPKSQCKMVDGGESFKLRGDLSVRVIKWNHSGNPSTPLGLLLQTPMELIDVPRPDPETRGLKPGILDQFPHGGIRAYLFTLKTAKGKITWLFSNSGNARTFEQPAAIDKTFLKKYNLTLNNLAIIPQKKSVKEYLMAAKSVEGLDSLNLWLGYGSSVQVKQVIAILKPKAFIPHHWDGVWNDFFKGTGRVFSNPKLTELLARENIKFLPQQQYMDKYILDLNGIHKVANHKVKEKLGFK